MNEKTILILRLEGLLGLLRKAEQDYRALAGDYAKGRADEAKFAADGLQSILDDE